MATMIRTTRARARAAAPTRTAEESIAASVAEAQQLLAQISSGTSWWTSPAAQKDWAVAGSLAALVERLREAAPLAEVTPPRYARR